MCNSFKSKGGSQSIGQGDHAIGSQTNNYGPVISTSGNQAPAVNAQTVTITYNNLPPDWMQYAEEFGVTKAALASFFRILEQEKIPSWELDSKLREIAFRHKELLQRFELVMSDDPQVKSLKEQAKQAIENGEYDQAEKLLDQAKERDREAEGWLEKSIEEQKVALEKRKLSRAESCWDQAMLQRLQYRYEKSAQYFQEASTALPEGHEWKRALCLGWAGYDLFLVARYTEALSLYEQSLSITREIGDRKGEGKMLHNISQIYHYKGDYRKALDYLEQSLPIFQEVGDKEGEGATLNNISQVYRAKGDWPNALKYLEQSLLIQREIGDKEGEGITLNNIGQIHKQEGDHAAAFKCYDQSLAISRESKNKHGESVCLNNISTFYYDQRNYDAALENLDQSLEIKRHIGDRRGEGTTLNNIGLIYKASGDYPAALKYYEHSFAIMQEIGAKAEEADGNWNIGLLYIKQGELAKAKQYISRAVELMEQLEHPMLENARNGLEAVRTKLRG